MAECPVCRCPLDAASGIDHDSAPKTGDFSVCIGCGAALRFTHDGGLRECDENDLGELSQNPEAAINILCLSIAIREMGGLR
jgi:hypothetical protein